LSADGVLIGTRAVPPGATSVDLALSLPLATAATVTATQTFNAVSSALSPSVSVAAANAPALPADVLTTARAITISGVHGGAYVVLLADGAALSAGVVPDNADAVTLPIPALPDGSVLTARQSAFGVTSPLSAPVTATNPPPALSLEPASLTLAFGVTGTLTISSSIPAPAGGLSVTVTATPAGVLTLTSPVVIPEGATEQTVSVTAAGFGSATVTVEAAAYVSAQAQVSVPAPTITGISPSSALQGSVTTVTISGSNLDGASAVAFAGGGLTGTVQSESQNAVEVTIVVPPGAQVGAYGFTLTLPSGEVDSGNVRLTVGATFQGQSLVVSPAISVFMQGLSGQGQSASAPVSVFFPSFSGQGVTASPPVSVFFPAFSGQGVSASSPVSVFFNHLDGQGLAVSPPVSVEITEQ
jgi:hypothetical protein